MRLMKPAEVATALGVSRATVYRLIAENEIPHIDVPHAGIRIDEAVLEECADRWALPQSQHVSRRDRQGGWVRIVPAQEPATDVRTPA
jgi:excisionase family DNA binding protein